MEAKEGIVHVNVSYYPNGNKRFELPEVVSRFGYRWRHGLCRWWYEDGTLKAEILYADGEWHRHGTVNFYHPNGTLHRRWTEHRVMREFQGRMVLHHERKGRDVEMDDKGEVVSEVFHG